MIRVPLFLSRYVHVLSTKMYRESIISKIIMAKPIVGSDLFDNATVRETNLPIHLAYS